MGDRAPAGGRGILVHEWLARTGGSENVFDAMVDAFPAADLLCLWSDVADRYPDRFLKETWLARTPLRRSKVSALPFMPITWRNRHPGGYEWALVSSHLFAHHVSFRERPEAFRKLVYVHSPARYLWSPELDSRGSGPSRRAAGAPLRLLDRKRVAEIDSIASNSHFVRDRVRRVWDRDSTVIYPPVDVERITSVANWAHHLDASDAATLASTPADFVLGASRFVPYKRLDLVIAAGQAAGLPVVLAGSGPERERLMARAERATVPVMFVDRPSCALLYALYQRSSAYVFPAVEDFGIMPVEAMAAGTPVVVGLAGGAVESVVDGVSGRHVDFADSSALAEAVRGAETMDRRRVAASAERFTRGRFVKEIQEFVADPEGRLS